MSRRAGTFTAALSIIIGLMITACGGAEPAGPPELRLGLDECSYCRMIISEPRFAAAGRRDDGEEARFDDLGCLLHFRAERGATRWTFWLQDATGGGWLAAEEAWIAHDPATITPMGHGNLAFADPETARARSENGEIHRLDELEPPAGR